MFDKRQENLSLDERQNFSDGCWVISEDTKYIHCSTIESDFFNGV
jgi:hypothetical protein